jgi:hypothetical protein
MEIGGLRFSKHTSRSVFELGEDGKYYSCDILFHSARNTDDSTDRDLLSDYLESGEVRAAFLSALNKAEVNNSLKGLDIQNISVFLPEKKQGEGIKTYNGVYWWYWLKPCAAGSAAGYVRVNSFGGINNTGASSVGGVAPAFCLV